MNKFLSTIIIIILVSTCTYGGGKVELKWRKFDTGLTEAKKSKKKILLDVYTDWCKWCKKLDAEVYTNEKVAKYLNKQYVIIKVNAESDDKITFKGEKMSERQLAQAFGVTGYPTIIFLESNGDAINKLNSFVPADRFFPIIQYIGDDYYKNMKWEEYLIKTGQTGKAVQ